MILEAFDSSGAIRGVDDTNGFPVKVTGNSSVADAQSGLVPGMGYNGATFDRWRNNTEGTLLVSAARTSSTNSATQKNYNARGIIVFLNITAASGTGGLSLRIMAVDPVSGIATALFPAPTAVTSTGFKVYMLYPGAGSSAALDVVSGVVLPKTFYITVAHSDGSSYTYSVGYSLIL